MSRGSFGYIRKLPSKKFPFDEGKDIVEGPLVYKDCVIVSLVGRYKTFTYPIPDGALCYSIPLRNFRNGWTDMNVRTHRGFLL